MHDNDYCKAIICILREMLKSLMNARAPQQQQLQQAPLLQNGRIPESKNSNVTTPTVYRRRGMNRITDL